MKIHCLKCFTVQSVRPDDFMGRIYVCRNCGSASRLDLDCQNLAELTAKCKFDKNVPVSCEPVSSERKT